MIDEPEDEDDDLLPLRALLDPFVLLRLAAKTEAKKRRRGPAAKTPAPSRIIWRGTKRGLGDEAVAVWKRGGIPNASTWQDAVKLFAARYADKDGKPISARNVIENMRRRFKDGKGGWPDPH